jgi:ABC-2 type transport system permease protein
MTDAQAPATATVAAAPGRAGDNGGDRLAPAGPLLAAQLAYQLRLLVRNPRALILSLLMPGLLLALRLGRVSPGTQAGGEFAAAVAGLAAFGLIATCYVTHAIGLVAARQDGVLRRWRASPLPRWAYFAGRVTATVLVGTGSAAVIVAVGVGMAGIHLNAGVALVLLVTFVLGGVAWAAAGTAISALVPTAQGANPVLIFTYLPVILFSGGFGSLTGLPHWLATVMSYLPGEPLIDAATHALRYTGGGVAPLPGRDLAVLAVWGMAGLLASLRFFRWDPVRPRHARHPAD